MIELIERILSYGGLKKDLILIIVSIIGIILELIFKLPFSWLAIILCGLPIILEACIGLITEFDIKADVLVSLALIASIIIKENMAAAEIATIMQIGALLEEITVNKAQKGIEKLVKLRPVTARKIINGEEKIISIDELKENDILKVLPGEIIPVDGVIIKGQTTINEAIMTGESMPIDKIENEQVISGTLNLLGAFEMRAMTDGENSSIQKMISLVKNTDLDQVQIIKKADLWATWIVIGALIAAFMTYLITKQITRSVTILVVFCPCALVLATPTALMAAIGNATKYGFIIRSGEILEKMAKVKNIVFDKTGTLTYGKFIIENITSYDQRYPKTEVARIIASMENNSEHPIGKAIVKDYLKDHPNNFYEIKNFKLMIGKGIEGILDGKKVIVGNQKLLAENNVKIIDDDQNKIYLAIDNNLVGSLEILDKLRDNASKLITDLKKEGYNTILLTGDNEVATKKTLKNLKLDEIKTNLLPNDKLKYIQEKQIKKDYVCMVGDGINDALALKSALTSIAMGKIGSDVAVEAADVVLINDEIINIVHLFQLSKQMGKIININIISSLILNFIAIYLAIKGLIDPIAGSLIHNLGSLVVIINSALLLKYKK